MRSNKNFLKVARWEIKKTLTNKTFLISVLVTPLLFLAFAILPTFFAVVENSRAFNIQVIDELGVFDNLNNSFNNSNLFTFSLADKSYEEISKEIKFENREGLIVFNQELLHNNTLTIYYGGEVVPSLNILSSQIQKVLRDYLLEDQNISTQIKDTIISGYIFNLNPLIIEEEVDIFEKLVPGLFAGFILLGVFITGTMIFQSAIQEKKNKVTEILLSSIKPEDLMMGKIFGFFIIGLFQVFVWFFFIFLLLLFTSNLYLLSYLLTPKLFLLLIFSIGGYLLYASLFVSMGATIEDISTSGNFQSIIVMIPLLPILFISAIVTDPNGLIAKIGTFIPFTTPAVMLFRLSISDNVPLIDILLSIFLLLIFTWLMIRVAGKIFKIGILKFGKNASFKEIYKWVFTK